MRSLHLTLFCLVSLCGAARASTITISGIITQDTFDLGVPAVSNQNLNSVFDGDSFVVTLTSAGAITSPGTFSLTSLLFTDSTAGVSESGFISGSLTIGLSGGNDQFSVLGCLPSCKLGNELDLNFQIPAAKLKSTNVAAQSIPALLPFDLLEDGGSTDIQGSIGMYSYSGAAGDPVPEPRYVVALAVLCLASCVFRKQLIR